SSEWHAGSTCLLGLPQPLPVPAAGVAEDRSADQPSNSRARAGLGTRDDRVVRAAQNIACVSGRALVEQDGETFAHGPFYFRPVQHRRFLQFNLSEARLRIVSIPAGGTLAPGSSQIKAASAMKAAQ